MKITSKKLLNALDSLLQPRKILGGKSLITIEATPNRLFEMWFDPFYITDIWDESDKSDMEHYKKMKKEKEKMREALRPKQK